VLLFIKNQDYQPNIWGGAGGGYYGLIQFGGPERSEAGLDPTKIGKYTIREQLPHVEKWLAGRGYKPGMGVEKLYATILGGNPNANIYAQDANRTSVANSLQSFLPGGSLYQRAQKTLGDPMYGSYTATTLPGSSDQASVSSDSEQQILAYQLLREALGSLSGSDDMDKKLANLVASRSKTNLTIPKVEDDDPEIIYRDSPELLDKNKQLVSYVRRLEDKYKDLKSEKEKTKAKIPDLMKTAWAAFAPGKAVI